MRGKSEFSAGSRDPRASLAAIRVFENVVLFDNPCEPVAATCLWINPEFERELRRKKVRAPKDYVAKKFGYRTCHLGGVYLDHAQWEKLLSRSKMLKSDSYFCHGGISHGSGRSVFVEDHQVKGVGRTNHAVFHGFFKDTDGSLSLSAAIREIGHQRRLASLLEVPPIQNDFLLLTRATQGQGRRLLIGRRGSPLRISHLEYLVGSSYRLNEPFRTARWRRFFDVLTGSDGVTARSVDRGLEGILDLAMTTIADVRLLGISLTNWPDNADLFSRALDCEDTSFGFSTTRKHPGLPRRRPGESPAQWFSQNQFEFGQEIPVHSLQILKNTLHGISLLTDAMRCEVPLKGRYLDWPDLEHRYSLALRKSLGRFLGCEELIHRSSFDRSFAELLKGAPLVPRTGAGVSPMELHQAFLMSLESPTLPKGLSRSGQLGARLGALCRKIASAQGRRAIAMRARTVAERAWGTKHPQILLDAVVASKTWEERGERTRIPVLLRTLDEALGIPGP